MTFRLSPWPLRPHTVWIFFLLAGALLLRAKPTCAQASEDADTTSVWTYDATGKLSGSQAAYKEWQEGGLNSLSFTASISGTAQRETPPWTQTHDLRIGFGLVTSEDDDPEEPIRKAEDQIRIESNVRYAGEGFFRVFEPTVNMRLRTQFAKGFDYTENPFPPGHPFAGREPPVQTSAFFAPAFLTESLGLTYSPRDWYSVRVGGAAKQTVVQDETLRTLYDVDPNDALRSEGGIELAGTVDREIFENVRYESNANVFFSFNQVEDPPDVLWEHYVTMQVNSWLSADLEVVALFDQNTSGALQLKEVISIGATIILI